MMKDQTFWKKYFADYDTLNQLIPYSDLLESISVEAGIKPGQKVLDAGSGTGNLSVRLATRGAAVTGIDFSQAGIEIHRSKSPEAELILHDLTKPLPFPAEFFDVIVSNNVLYTIPRPTREKIFEEFYRVLKPGGTIVISNLVSGFSPFKIYISHLKAHFQKCGFFSTAAHLLSLVIPTVRIFYYNYLIQKENRQGSYHFFEKDEQKTQLEKTGFKHVLSRAVYANQAILSVATK